MEASNNNRSRMILFGAIALAVVVVLTVVLIIILGNDDDAEPYVLADGVYVITSQSAREMARSEVAIDRLVFMEEFDVEATYLNNITWIRTNLTEEYEDVQAFLYKTEVIDEEDQALTVQQFWSGYEDMIYSGLSELFLIYQDNRLYFSNVDQYITTSRSANTLNLVNVFSATQIADFAEEGLATPVFTARAAGRIGITNHAFAILGMTMLQGMDAEDIAEYIDEYMGANFTIEFNRSTALSLSRRANPTMTIANNFVTVTGVANSSIEVEVFRHRAAGADADLPVEERVSIGTVRIDLEAVTTAEVDLEGYNFETVVPGEQVRLVAQVMGTAVVNSATPPAITGYITASQVVSQTHTITAFTAPEVGVYEFEDAEDNVFTLYVDANTITFEGVTVAFTFNPRLGTISVTTTEEFLTALAEALLDVTVEDYTDIEYTISYVEGVFTIAIAYDDESATFAFVLYEEEVTEPTLVAPPAPTAPQGVQVGYTLTATISWTAGVATPEEGETFGTVTFEIRVGATGTPAAFVSGEVLSTGLVLGANTLYVRAVNAEYQSAWVSFTVTLIEEPGPAPYSAPIAGTYAGEGYAGGLDAVLTYDEGVFTLTFGTAVLTFTFDEATGVVAITSDTTDFADALYTDFVAEDIDDAFDALAVTGVLLSYEDGSFTLTLVTADENYEFVFTI